MTDRTEGHDVFAELAAGHALYALEPGDEQAFLAHVSGCAACESDVAEHRETLAHLAYAGVDEEPPASLLEGIRAGVRESGRASTYTDAIAAAASLDQARARRDRRRNETPRLRRAATWLGAAAAIALVAMLGVWNTELQRDSDNSKGRLDQLVQALENEDSRTVSLRSEDGEVLAVAVVSGRRMDLVVDGLEPNDAESTSYVLWGRNSLGGVRPVAAFDVQGSAQVLDQMTLNDEMDAFMVTREKGNTPPPVSTQPVLATGEV